MEYFIDAFDPYMLHARPTHEGVNWAAFERVTVLTAILDAADRGCILKGVDDEHY